MREFFRCAVLTFMLVPTQGKAQDFEAGLIAATAGDFATAFREWTPAGETTNATAQFYLGLLYEDGLIYVNNLGLPQDYAEAAKWYRLAAEQGHGDAQRNLGRLYEAGDGVSLDLITAYMWYSLAAAKRSAFASSSRDELILQLSTEEISTAQRRAQVCLKTFYRDCD